MKGREKGTERKEEKGSGNREERSEGQERGGERGSRAEWASLAAAPSEHRAPSAEGVG